MPSCIVSHTHWDRAWYLPFQEFRLRLVDLIDRVLTTLENDPRFRAFLLDGQSIILEDYLDIRHGAAPRIESLVRDGRLQIGPWYVLPDEFLVSGEALIRNLQLGMAIADGFGGATRIGYVPDSFGHVHTFPQILNGFGITGFVFMRGVSADEYERLGREFVWDGPAGSAVVAVYLRDGYYNAASLGFPATEPHPVAMGDFEHLQPDSELAVAQLRERIARAKAGSRAPAGLLMNGMDHMPIQPELPDLIEAYTRAEGAEALQHTTLDAYLSLVAGIAGDLRHFSGELRGNAHHPILAGVHSARVYLKQLNHRVQALLESHAEPLCAALGSAGARDAPLLHRAWRHLLSTHAHDQVCGCSVDSVHADDEYQLRQAEQIALAVSRRAAERLAAAAGIAPAADEAVVLVHNGHARRARRPVRARVFLPVPDAVHLTLYDVDGAEVDVEVHSVQRRVVEPRFLESIEGSAFDVTFLADVPAAGYTFYRAAPAPHVPMQVWQQPAERVTLGLWQVSVGRASILLHPPGGAGGVPLQLEDEADGGDTYSFSPVDEDGSRNVVIRKWTTTTSPVASRLRVELEMDTPSALDAAERITSPLHLELSAAAGSGELNIEIEMDNRARDHRLRLLIPVGAPVAESRANVPFGAVTHTQPTLRPRGEAGEAPYPTHFSGDFVLAHSEGTSTLIVHRGQHEYELVERQRRGFVAVTLLRAVGMLSRTGGRIRSVQAGPAVAVPGAQCLGAQRFELALHSVEGELSTADAAGLAGEFARPPLAVSAAPGAGATQAPLYPARRSLVRLEPDCVTLSALRIRDDDRLIMRVWNRGDTPADACIELLLPFEAVDRCRLDERDSIPAETDGSAVHATLAPGELMTLCYTLVP